MSVFAYMSMTGPGVATPPLPPVVSGTFPTAFPWLEPFDQPSIGSLQAQYTTSYLFVSDPSFMAVASGYLAIRGDPTSPGLPQQVEINPPTFAVGAREIWMQIQFEMVGGVYDESTCAIQTFIWSNSGTMEIDIDGFGGMTGEDWELYLSPGGSNPQSAISKNVTAGSHTLIMCASELSPTSWQGELWFDSAPGSAPITSSTAPKTAGDMFDTLSITLRGPQDSARSVHFLDLSVIAGNRASDPFGIL